MTFVFEGASLQVTISIILLPIMMGAKLFLTHVLVIATL